MKRFSNPSTDQWGALCRRPQGERTDVSHTVRSILDNVRSAGDRAVAEYSERFDGCCADLSRKDPFRIAHSELVRLAQQVPAELCESIAVAIRNITAFHSAQLAPPQSAEIFTLPGVRCFRRRTPINRVGLYVPGGSAPLFSTLLMLAIPAQVAECSEICVATPPQHGAGIAPVIAAACIALGIERVVSIGGAQAIAAFAYGTESIQRVDKICGPGNRFVNEAKLQVAAEGVAIDLPAGPSEALVIADQNCNPAAVAADFLAQAEHGEDSQVVLATTSEAVFHLVETEIASQLESLPRAAIARKALEESFCVLFSTLEECFQFSNSYAPEHLLLSIENAESYVTTVQNAGSVFLGYETAEAFGDYASGTNHVLPTNGCARGYSGLSVDSFMKTISYQQIDNQGIAAIGPATVEMARAEGLEGHARAVLVRSGGLRD